MKRWLHRILIATALLGVVGGICFEAVTHIGRGWWYGEPFYDGRPASFWADEIEHWETQDPDWRTQVYVRHPVRPTWLQRIVPEPPWPRLLDGDPDALTVLKALGKHPSGDVRDWARIGIERIDNSERGEVKIKRHDVLVTAELFEVDEATYVQVEKGKWRSTAELERLEQDFLNGRRADNSLFDLLGKQKLLMSVKDIKITDGKAGLLLSSTKEITCLPRPLHVRLGRNDPQRIEEGMALRAHVQIIDGGRFVRIQFIEKVAKLEGIDKVDLMVDNTGRMVTAEVANVKECVFSTPRNVPDGGTLLIPMQYRPMNAKDGGRRLVARIGVRIQIEEEERRIRALPDR